MHPSVPNPEPDDHSKPEPPPAAPRRGATSRGRGALLSDALHYESFTIAAQWADLIRSDILADLTGLEASSLQTVYYEGFRRLVEALTEMELLELTPIERSQFIGRLSRELRGPVDEGIGESLRKVRTQQRNTHGD